MNRWTIAAVLAGVLFFIVGMSNEVYRLTSPPALSFHILVRKAYGIAAFAVVGYLLRRALEEHAVTRTTGWCVGGMATYSALLEFAQAAEGANEGLAWNAFDTACGALGGALAAAARQAT